MRATHRGERMPWRDGGHRLWGRRVPEAGEDSTTFVLKGGRDVDEKTRARSQPPAARPGVQRLRPAPPSTLGTLRGRRRLRRRRCLPRGPRSRTSFPVVFEDPQPPPPAMLPTLPPQVRQNYHPDCEAAVNCHKTLEHHASLTCQALAFYLQSEAVALGFLGRFFLRLSDQHNQRAEELMRLQNQRGGRVTFPDIPKPDTCSWESGLKAMQCVLLLEGRVTQSLLGLRQLAADKRDPQLRHFLQIHCLNPQAELTKELADHITTVSKMEAVGVDTPEALFKNLTLDDGDEN
ncbi:ferritin heavy chain-like [Hippopotamus amphibius kiboko]|uniref:ferritin heavy chain-like n=1 Tax=Hippopotamus amphibius kiboko TaxID=575201 RepID=UPI002598BB78|nr:ferritin heavy chain-like [Hippopotamus amphibius kiboko]